MGACAIAILLAYFPRRSLYPVDSLAEIPYRCVGRLLGFGQALYGV